MQSSRREVMRASDESEGNGSGNGAKREDLRDLRKITFLGLRDLRMLGGELRKKM